MFEKKDYVYADTLGVCRVDEITNLMQKDGTVLMYYGLRSMRENTKTAYYPVEHHEVNIRPLISLEEATRKLENAPEDMSVNEKYEALFVIELDKKNAEKAKKKK